MSDDLQSVLREMSGRLSAIETALKPQQHLLSDHERRIRAAEIKIYTIWTGMILIGGVLGYWLEGLLR